MMRRLLLAALLAIAVAPVGRAQTEPDHTFQIRSGEVYYDGQHVPNAVPDSLDLAGVTTGVLAVTGGDPYLDVDGAIYVFDGRKLVPYSNGPDVARRTFYEVPPLVPESPVPPGARMTSLDDGAYFQETSGSGDELRERMQRSQQLQIHIIGLAEQVRQTPPGPRRDALREQLSGELSDMLTLKQELIRAQARVLRDRLDLLQNRLEQWDDQHQEMIELWMKELLGPDATDR